VKKERSTTSAREKDYKNPDIRTKKPVLGYDQATKNPVVQRDQVALIELFYDHGERT
jgi:hypothetical protein